MSKQEQQEEFHLKQQEQEESHPKQERGIALQVARTGETRRI